MSARKEATIIGRQNRDLQQALARLAAELPDTRWLALLGRSGQLLARFPASGVEADRVAAMGAAIQSLGERVSRELEGGPLHFAVVAGELGWHVVVVLDRDHCLELGVRPGASLDTLFPSLLQSGGPLLELLGIQPT